MNDLRALIELSYILTNAAFFASSMRMELYYCDVSDVELA
jgi:hypothetical protein